VDAKRRVGYLISQYPYPRHAYLTEEIRALRQQGLEVTLAAIRPDMRPAETLTSDERAAARETFYIFGLSKLKCLWGQATTVCARPRGYIRGIACALKYGRGQPQRTLRSLFYLAEAAVTGQFFVSNGICRVHSHYTSTVAWMLSVMFPEIEVSMSIHGSAEFADPYFCLAEKARACRNLIRVISQRGYDQLAAAAAPQDRNKIRLSRLGIQPEKFIPIEFRPSPDRFRLLFAGGTEPPRSVDIILRALSELREEFCFEFHIIGDGANCMELKSLAAELRLQDRVIFHGWKSQDAIRVFAADIVVLSSDAEGIPVALMEAMCRKICCIASDVGGVSELIGHGENGFLTKAGDVAAMTAAIRRAIENPDLRQRLGVNARARVLEEYDLGKNVAAFADLLFEDRLPTVAITPPS
jgi:colanic acid/amylovoran biosynthesis glycosyltransferase